MRKRRRMDGGAGRGGALAALAALAMMLAGWIWAKLARRPVDSVAILGAAAVSLIIIINAVFLQAGSHRGPFVANPLAPPQLAASRSQLALPSPGASAALRAPVGQQSASSVDARRNDPIGDLIGATVGSLRRVRGGD
jgi:hypothetical protein